MSFYCKEELICLFHFCIQPFFLYHCGFVNISFIPWVRICYYSFLLLKFPRFGLWEPLQVGSCVFLTYTHHFMRTFYLLVQDTPDYLYFLCFRPFNQLSLLGSLYWIMIFRNQDLDAKCACSYWGVFACGFFWLTEPGNTYMCTHACKHTFITVCISVWICIEIWILKAQIPIKHHRCFLRDFL